MGWLLLNFSPEYPCPGRIGTYRIYKKEPKEFRSFIQAQNSNNRVKRHRVLRVDHRPFQGERYSTSSHFLCKQLFRSSFEFTSKTPSRFFGHRPATSSHFSTWYSMILVLIDNLFFIVSNQRI